MLLRLETKNAPLVALAMMAAAVMVGCGGIKRVDRITAVQVGGVSLSVRVAEGVDVNKVDYELAGNDIAPIAGTIALLAPGTTPAVTINGLPPAQAYKVTGKATSVDGKYTCTGTASFNVFAGQVTAVSMTLLCRQNDQSGSATITAGFNFCPTITSYVVAPLAVAVGGNIQLSATVVDKDTSQPTITWTAPAGTFASPSSSQTTYTCTSAGQHSLTMKVSDGTCDDTFTVNIQCVSVGASCGNGVVEHGKGEECDPPNVLTCSPTCTNLPACGNGRVETGEDCDPPNGTTCSATCRNILGAGDAGAPGDGGTPDAGTGAADAAMAPFDAPISAPDATISAPDAAKPDTGGNVPDAGAAACQRCLNDYAELREFRQTSCAPNQLCVAALDCLLAAKTCWGRTPAACYCGETATALETCEAPEFQPEGDCATPLRAGAGAAATNADVLNRLFDPEFPTGIAGLVVNAAYVKDDPTTTEIEGCKAACF